MKSFIVLGVLLALASCGKDKSGSSSGSSYSSLKDAGIIVQTNGQYIAVLCSQNGKSNQKRLQEVQEFLQKINKSNDAYVKINDTKVEKYRLANVLNQSMYVLQQASGSMYGQNPYQQNPYQQNPYMQNPYQNPYQQNPYGQNPYQQNQYGNVNNQCPAQVLAQG